MTSETLELRIPTTIWYSNGDEDNFFRWLYSIPGYVECVGRGRTLFVTISLSKVEKISMQEFVALFRRYSIDDAKQLRGLSASKYGDWFSDPKNYWHEYVFID